MKGLPAVVLCALLSVSLPSNLVAAQSGPSPSLSDGGSNARVSYAAGWCASGSKGTLGVSGLGIREVASDKAKASPDQFAISKTIKVGSSIHP